MSAERALGSRWADFWTLGGASLLVWLALQALQPFHEGGMAPFGEFARGLFRNLGATAAVLTLVVNNPHFMASYKLAYGRGLQFTRQHWAALILVPALLAAVLLGGWLAYGTGTQETGAFPWVGRVFGAVGLSSPIGPRATAGGALVTLVVQLMWLTVGWHYAKQVYGCMMVYAHFDGYPLTRPQRDLIRWSLNSIWVAAYVGLNLHHNEYAFSNIPFYGLDFPRWLLWLTCAATLGLTMACWLTVIRPNLEGGRKPSPQFLVPYLAFLAWWFPLFEQAEFNTLMVPLFHALQYIPFVRKVEQADARRRGRPRVDLYLGLVAVGLLLAGAVVFNLGPGWLDAHFDTPHRNNAFFFVGAVALFVNIHHYFLDATIWRISKDPWVREGLLA